MWLAGLMLAGSLLACLGGSQRPELVFAPDTLPEAQAGQAYRVTISVTQNETPVGDMYVDTGELPPGLALTFDEASGTAEISGTPSQAGVTTFSVSAWCFGTNVSGQTGQKEYELTVN